MYCSVIIATYNRRKSLDRSLVALANQSVPASTYEIIVVDDGSTDATKETVLESKKHFPANNILCVSQPHGGVAKARNLGVAQARGEILFFTDDDCAVPPNWVESLLDGYRRYPDVVGVGGWYKPGSNDLAKLYLQRYLDYVDGKKIPPLNSTEMRTNIYSFTAAGNTSNMSYKKKIFAELGGFDEKLYFTGAVDLEFKIRVQSRSYYLLYLPIFVAHFKKMTPMTYLKRYFNQGRGRYYISLKYPGLLAKDTAFNFSFVYTFHSLATSLLDHTRFFPAHLITQASMLAGKLFMRAKGQFKNVGRPDLATNVKTYELVSKNVQSGRISITRFSPFTQLVAQPEKIYSTIRPQEKNRSLVQYSIVIPTYNRHKNLLCALESLVKQTIPGPEYEIIVVDDGSRDATQAVVIKFQKKYPQHQVRYFFQSNAGPAAARNRGVKESRGKIIFFTDDDCIVPQNWIETLLDGFRRYPKTVGVAGWLEPPREELKKSAASRYYKLAHTQSQEKYEILSNNPLKCFSVFAYNTANMAYKKEILGRVGGFDTNFYWPGGEDNDLAFRITLRGHYLLYIPLNVTHSKLMSLSDFVKLHFRRGANGFFLRTIHRDTLEKIGPGFADSYGSIPNLARYFGGSEIFLFFLSWFGMNLGIIYMRHKLAKSGHPIPSEP